jgi:[acyl-carrier-protein] S-malonyltransferase
MIRSAFLFPGQGAQYVGMGAELTATVPAAKALFDRASTILGYDLLNICIHGPAERLNSTEISQPAIFVASLAAVEKLRETSPDLFPFVHAAAGLSLGEYTALVFAGAMSFEEGLRVVQIRGQAMQAAANATPSGMVALLGLELLEVESLIAEVRSKGLIEVANLLCPGNIVVSGELAAIDEVCALAASRSLRVARLAVAGAFHTALMKPADEKLAEALQAITIQEPTIPVWSNVTGQPHANPAEISGLLVRQVLSPVQWEATLRDLVALHYERFYEIGPGRVLAGLLKRIHRKADIQNVQA